MACKRKKGNKPNVLKKLYNSSVANRKKILTGKGNIRLVKNCCEVADNILKGNVKLTEKQRGKLVKQKDNLKALAKRSNSYKYKRNQLVQKGGFLPALLAPLIVIAGGFLGEYIGKKVK